MVVAGVLALLVWARVAAIDPRPDSAALREAVALAGSGTDELDRFHAAYRVGLRGFRPSAAGTSFDELEVLTPIRRVVLAATEQLRAGHRRWGLREAEAVVRPYRGLMSIVVFVTYPPQNVLRTMPRLEIVVTGRAGARAAETRAREAWYTPRSIAGVAVPAGSPFVRGSVEAVFDTSPLDPRGQSVVSVREGGQEVARAAIDFGRLR